MTKNKKDKDEVIKMVKNMLGDRHIHIENKDALIPTEIKITKAQFNRYEGCRLSGVTNMFDVINVQMLTGLTKKECIYIMENYEELLNKHSDEQH